MEALLLTAAALGATWLIFIGVSVLLAGVTADEASEFRFAQRLWVRHLTGLALIAVAPAWAILLPDTFAGWTACLAFAAVGAWFFWGRRRLDA